MDALRGTDDAGRVAHPLDPENLRLLLEEAPASVVVEPAEGPGPAARAQRTSAERWLVSVSTVAAGPVVAEVPNTDAAFDVLRSWVADDGWWEEAFSWRPVSG